MTKARHAPSWPTHKVGGLGLGQKQQGKRHDGQAAKQQQGAGPQIRNAAQAQSRGVGVAAVADQGAQRCKHHGDGDRQSHPPSGHLQLHDHDPVERAHQERRHHADHHLEQRQAQQRAIGSSGEAASANGMKRVP
jgi:hypothetical protein